MSDSNYHPWRSKKVNGFDIFFNILGVVIFILLACIVLYAAFGMGKYSGRAEIHEQAVKFGVGEWVIRETGDPRQPRAIQFQWVVPKLPNTINPSATETTSVEPITSR